MTAALSSSTAGKVCPVTGTSAAADLADQTTAQTLTLTVVRCRLAGYDFGDIACWELAAETLDDRLGPVGGLVEAELSRFVRRLRKLMGRPFSYHPHPSRAMSEDEALLLDLLAHAERAPDRARAIAPRLSADPDEIVGLAVTTAARLSKAGLELRA